MADYIVKACIELYNKLPKTGKPSANEWTVISAIVGVFSDNKIKVLSLGTGSKCIGKSSMSSNGDILNDSHAEVIARRAFLKYLYFQIIQLNTTNSCEVLYKDEKNNFYVKDSVKFYFVTGMSPCGDASIMPKSESCYEDEDSIGLCLEDVHKKEVTIELKRVRNDSHEDIDKKKIKMEDIEEKEKMLKEDMGRESEGQKLNDIHRTGAKCLPQSSIQDPHLPGFLYHSTGAVRTKPGRGDPTLSLSCSDKIARWNAVGWQGALLSFFIQSPIFVDAIICGKHHPFSKKSFDRAVNERITRENFIPIQVSDIEFPDIKTKGKKPNPSSIIWCDSGEKVERAEKKAEVSINGRKLGVTKKNLKKTSARTSICKKELFILFEKALNSIDKKDEFLRDRIGNLSFNSVKDISYGELKSRAVDYQKNWKLIKEKCFKVWAQKPSNLLDFTLREVEE